MTDDRATALLIKLVMRGVRKDPDTKFLAMVTDSARRAILNARDSNLFHNVAPEMVLAALGAIREPPPSILLIDHFNQIVAEIRALRRTRAAERRAA